MKNFGIKRVVEPVGAIPSTAWKLDNNKEIDSGEIRVSLDIIKLEDSNFSQICSSANYNETKIKNRIFDIINKRGKLQNPYTESGGVLAGTIEAVGEDFEDATLKVGDEIVSLTSISGLPMHIEEITKIDYDYGQIHCKGYAILFDGTKIKAKPENVDIKTFLFVLDEEGSLVDVRNILVNTKPKRIGIIGSNLAELLIYSKMVQDYDPQHVEICSILEEGAASFTGKKDFLKAFGDLAESIYFVDMSRPVVAFQKIFEEEGQRYFDAIINLEEIKGAEAVAALLINKEGTILHTGVKRNILQSLLAVDCTGKEATVLSVDGYAGGVYEYAIHLCQQLEEKFKLLEQTFSHRSKKSMKASSAIDNKGLEANRIEDFVFMSPVTSELVENTLNVAKYDCNVIIQGETGVGKERIMDLLHQNSQRKGKPCIKINCATIQENLAESEFFGYEKGSFTGAVASGKEGYFEMANNGTLFLDEIGSLSLAMQSKLLRVLQENSFYRVGGTTPKNVNVRVVCANNVPLKKLVEEGKFREDLYYRLNICMLEVPPLRKRKEDILCLADTFIGRYSKKYGVEKSFSEEAKAILSKYHWPGNVRELENMVHRVYISEKDVIIDGGSIARMLDDSVYDEVVVDIKKELKAESNIDFNKLMDEQEKRIISYALKKEKTTRKAAEFLGIPQATLARKKIKYDL